MLLPNPVSNNRKLLLLSRLRVFPSRVCVCVRILSARRYFFSSRKDRPAMSPARVISNALYYPSSVERGRGMEKRCEDRTCDMWNGRIKSWYAVDRLGLRETTEERDSIIRTRVVKPRGGSSADRTLKLPGV